VFIIIEENYDMSKKNGFTLVELLVVIAIMAVLLTLLTPALTKARKHAKMLVCQTNLRSMQTATVQYFQKYEKGFEYELYSGSPRHDIYINELSAYVDNVDEARYCPSTFVPENRNATSGHFGSATEAWLWVADTPEPEYGSFALNGFIYTDPYDVLIPVWFAGYEHLFVNTQNKIDRIGADQIPGFADSVWVDAWPDDTNLIPAGYDLSGIHSNQSHMARLITNRHNDRTNISFMDGHVQNIFLNQLWSFKWHTEFQTESIKFRQDGSEIYQ
jgi:prepilin-type N-terminal cleavage/methylation domain-containing protein/prepilin-type processing-associated H-X9-DG protein